MKVNDELHKTYRDCVGTAMARRTGMDWTRETAPWWHALRVVVFIVTGLVLPLLVPCCWLYGSKLRPGPLRDSEWADICWRTLLLAHIGLSGVVLLYWGTVKRHLRVLRERRGANCMGMAFVGLMVALCLIYMTALIGYLAALLM